MPPEGSSEITTSIGGRYKARESFSRPVLISREAWPGYIVSQVLSVFTASRFGRHPLWGGYGGGVTPLPIPNREVKPSSADGTARETGWESRSPPGVNREGPSRKRGAFFFDFGPRTSCWVGDKMVSRTRIAHTLGPNSRAPRVRK